MHEDFLIPAPDDGLPAPEVGSWVIEKYRRLGMYAEMFSTGMKNQWPRRVYIDLFAGSGHSMLRDSRLRVLGSPLIALSIRDPFTHYIFCEKDAVLLDALKQRANVVAPNASPVIVAGDANASVQQIASHIPPHSKRDRVLSFCFVDPYNLGDVHFDTLQALGAARAMDFLILLAVGMDAVRNWATYLRQENTTIDRLLGDTKWRARWALAEAERISHTRFVATEFATAMSRLGYLTTSIERMREVRSTDKNLPLYYLAFFSKHERGYRFWEEVLKYSTHQRELPFQS